MKKVGAVALLLLCLPALASCGYALVGRGNVLPSDVRSIHVPAFVNRTTRVEIEQRLTQAVASELVARAGLRLVSDPAQTDAILRGEITSVSITPVAFNDQGRATRYQVSINAGIELVDHRNDDAVIWKNDHYSFSESYAVEAGSLEAFDQETRALQEIAELFAESVVASILEGF